MMARMIAKHVYYEGRVQGVGFRYSTRRLAQGYEVCGWVRNLPDGRVEMLVGGEPQEVEAFLQGIAESELGDFIRKTQTASADVGLLASTRGFTIST